MLITKRTFFRGLASIITAPAIIPIHNLMAMPRAPFRFRRLVPYGHVFDPSVIYVDQSGKNAWLELPDMTLEQVRAEFPGEFIASPCDVAEYLYDMRFAATKDKPRYYFKGHALFNLREIVPCRN